MVGPSGTPTSVSPFESSIDMFVNTQRPLCILGAQVVDFLYYHVFESVRMSSQIHAIILSSLNVIIPCFISRGGTRRTTNTLLLTYTVTERKTTCVIYTAQ